MNKVDIGRKGLLWLWKIVEGVGFGDINMRVESFGVAGDKGVGECQKCNLEEE